jgi:hypothetical protein
MPGRRPQKGMSWEPSRQPTGHPQEPQPHAAAIAAKAGHEADGDTEMPRRKGEITATISSAKASRGASGRKGAGSQER